MINSVCFIDIALLCRSITPKSKPPAAKSLLGHSSLFWWKVFWGHIRRVSYQLHKLFNVVSDPVAWILFRFREKELIHKTLHRYTVRAKQGGSQASRDGASGGLGGPNSAGASLRRYGEQAIRAVSRTSLLSLLRFSPKPGPHSDWREFIPPSSSCASTEVEEPSTL